MPSTSSVLPNPVQEEVQIQLVDLIFSFRLSTLSGESTRTVKETRLVRRSLTGGGTIRKSLLYHKSGVDPHSQPYSFCL